MDLLAPTPPHDPYAEQAALGACLLDGSEVSRIRSEVQADDFHSEQNRRIFRAILAVSEPIPPADMLFAVQDRLKSTGEYEDCGGVPYLMSLFNALPAAADGPAYAKVVADLARRRRWIYSVMEILQRSYDRREDPADLANRMQGHIQQLLAQGQREGVLLGEAALDVVAELRALAAAGKSAYTTWGFTSLDLACGGLPDKYVVVAGRPGMGKTSFMLDCAQRNARATGKWNLLFSLETRATHLAINAVGARAGVDTQDMQRAGLVAEEWQRAEDAAVRLLDSPVYIVDTPALRPSDIRRVAERFRARAREAGTDLGVVWIDHLQKVKAPRGTTDTEQVTAVSGEIADISLAMGLPVVALSQLSRKVEERADKRPLLSDLRQSGAIEQDARMVVFIYRDGYYKRMDGVQMDDTEPEPVEFNIAKNNGGKVGQVQLAFIAAWTKFGDYDRRR